MHMPSRRELITEQMELREREESIPHETQREREHIAEHKAREHTEGRTHGQGHDTSPHEPESFMLERETMARIERGEKPVRMIRKLTRCRRRIGEYDE